MDDLAAIILRRGPEILEEAATAVQPRLAELYDEAEDWRQALREAHTPNPEWIALWRAATAVIWAVSAVFFEKGGADHRGNPYFMEKVGEAKVAIERVRRFDRGGRET